MLKKSALVALALALAAGDADARCRAKRNGPIRRIFAAVRPAQSNCQSSAIPAQTSRAAPDSPTGRPVFFSSPSSCPGGVCPLVR